MKRLSRTSSIVIISLCGAALVGCDALLGILTSSSTTVVLQNDAGGTLNVELFYHEQQDLPEFSLETLGEEVNRSIPAGSSATFSRSCSDLQIIQITDAEVNLGLTSPDVSSAVFRDGDDFSCGDTITFTFTTNALATDLDVAFSRSSSSIAP